MLFSIATTFQQVVLKIYVTINHENILSTITQRYYVAIQSKSTLLIIVPKYVTTKYKHISSISSKKNTLLPIAKTFHQLILKKCVTINRENILITITVQ